jgi:hypothetical protein
MSEALKPNNLGVSGLLELAQMVTPPGHETVGFEDEGGNFFSLEQLKALEGQENKMSDPIQKAIDSLKSQSDAKPKFVRQVRKCFHLGNTFLAIANDETVWCLRRLDENSGGDFWEQLLDAQTPPLPQPEGF